MRSTFALTSLSLLASSVLGAPINLGGTGSGSGSGSANANVNANANLNANLNAAAHLNAAANVAANAAANAAAHANAGVHAVAKVGANVVADAKVHADAIVKANANVIANANANVHANAQADVKAVIAASAAAKAELKVFADFLFTIVSGGKHTVISAANLGLLTSLTANLNLSAFAKTCNTVCVSAYSNPHACTELTAFLSATYWAHLAGWAGVDLFAALGATRLDRWHGLLSGVCSTSTTTHSACTGVFTHFDTWVAAAANVQANVIADSRIKLDAFGLLSTIDASAILKADASGFIKISPRADRRLLGSGGVTDITAAAKAKLDAALAASLSKNGLNLGAVTGLAANGVLLIDGKLLPDVLASLGIKLDSTNFLSINKGGLFLFSSTSANAGAHANVHVPRVLGNIVAGAKAKIDAAVAATLDKNGLRLGAITGIAADGVLLVDGVRLTDVLAVVGVKLDNKSFLDIGKDGLYLFSATNAVAGVGAIVTRDEEKRVLPNLGLGGIGLHSIPVVPHVVAAGQAGVGAVGAVVANKNGVAAGLLANAAGAGFLGVN